MSARPHRQRHRLLLLAVAVLAAGGVTRARGRPDDPTSLEAWLLARDGLRVRTLVPLEPPSAFRDGRWLMLASLPRNDTADLYVLTARVAPGGRPIAVSVPVNLSLSEWADDTDLVVHGLRAATCVRELQTGKVVEVHVRDFGGERSEVTGTAAWSRTERAKNAVLNWADTASLDGVDLRVFRLEPPVDQLTITLDDTRGVALVPRGVTATIEELSQEPKERLPLLHWVANVGRRFDGLGPAVELLKEVYFTATEAVAVAKDTLGAAPVDEAPVAPKAEVQAAVEKARLLARASTHAWPPAPLELTLDDRQEGEGLWAEVSAHRTRRNPNAPPPFYQTYVRVPAERGVKKRVYIGAWDPAQVSLRFQTGTSEPISTTGIKGSGRIPRDPAVLARVVGAFNGGFQTYHGKYGVVVDRRLYVPPLPGIGTVVATADGRTGFGTWEANATLPEHVLDLRQNLPPVVEDGVINPYGIVRWGASQDVAGAVGAFTVRSGLCRTRESHVAYFWCEFCDVDGLGRAMLATRCDYGIHLDMNAGHSGFELFRPFTVRTEPAERAKAAAQEPDRKSALHEVELPGGGGQWFFATRLVERMAHMYFPRYLKTDYRDYFYLVLRDVMPGAGTWRTEGLVGNDTWPPVVAVDPQDPTRVELDPERLVAELVRVGESPRQAPTGTAYVLDLAADEVLAAPAEGALFVTSDGRLTRKSEDGRVALSGARFLANGPFLVVEKARLGAVVRTASGWAVTPLTGGESLASPSLAPTTPRLLLSVTPARPAAFRLGQDRP